MEAYKETFLSKELNKALNDVLVCVHHHFRKVGDINEGILKEIYKPILEYPDLKDDVVWLNAWRRRYVGKSEIYFIKGNSSELSKDIIKVWHHCPKEYDQYVNSLSVLAKNYGLIKRESGGKEELLSPIDYSFLITTKNDVDDDIKMASEYIRDFFVYLKFKDVKKLFNENEFTPLRKQIESSQNNEKNKTIIKILKEQYERLKNEKSIDEIIDNLTNQLNTAWKSSLGDGNNLDINTLISKEKLFKPDKNVLTEGDHKTNIIKLINYYFWVKLAYPEGWNVLLYLPGVIAKKFEAVPLGVNIGLKRMPPLEIILFLKKAILLFFTRASIDYFEEVTKGTIISHGRSTAAAAIMARNMSHNIGSHVLANISLSEIKERPADMFMLNSYLQQRMDFVACMSTVWPEWTEPIFFYSDLIQGFLDQGLLLDYLVQDDGYKAEKIKFNIKKGINKICFTFKKETEQGQKETEFSHFTCKENDVNGDFLVALPGGPIGKQAFYGFLENAIRNAAKHNPKQEDGSLEVFINVEETGKHFYPIRYYDNLSHNRKVDGKYLVDEVQDKIDDNKTPLVDDTGRLMPNNWGIQEMKAYAKFLAYPRTEGESEVYVLKDKNGQKFYLCAEPFTQNSSDLLSYKFGLQKANLILIIDDKQNLENKGGLQNIGVYFDKFEDEDQLKKQIRLLSPQLFILHKNDNEKRDKILEFIKQHHSQLPTRIILGSDGKKRIDNLNSGNIPGRRVCNIPLTTPNDCSPETWQKFFINVYKEWVIQFAGHKKFNLVIHFDRDDKDFIGFANWKKLRDDLKFFGLSDFIKIFLYRRENNQAVPLEAEDDIAQVANDGTWLFFDNHNRMLSEKNNKNNSFYQILGHYNKINNHTIFDQFRNASSGFSGIIFLLQLIETSCTKILIIDDRVAAYVAEVNNNGMAMYNEKITYLTDANIFYNLSFNYCHKRTCLIKNMEIEAVEDEKNGKLEGVHIGESSNVEKIIVLKGTFQGSKNFEVVSDFDVVVIHWGWLEKQRELEGVDFDPDMFLKSLEAFSRRVILTSGRGKPENMPKEYPFIEFSTVENYLMRELSKYHLGKALASVF